MKERVVLDLSKLPQHGLQSASPTWWGTLAFMLIEGTGFALAVAIYLYLLSLAPRWPAAATQSRTWSTGHCRWRFTCPSCRA